jgi:FkbM family methyltransferase
MGWEKSRLWKVFLPHKLFVAVGHLLKLLSSFPKDIRPLGFLSAWILLRLDIEHWLRSIFQRTDLDRMPRSLVALHLKGYPHPLFIRRNSSDRFIVRQVFRQREYGSVPLMLPIRLFVDAGANIGCASFYLLQQFPQAHAEVIEPDPENLVLCRQNLEPFASRIRFRAQGVWPRSASLRLIKPAPGAELESTISVIECLPGERGDVQSVSLDDVLAQQSQAEFDLVKMDIEGAERAVLEDLPAWLGSTRNLMIELHGPESRRVFEKVLTQFSADRTDSVGDVTVCAGWRPRPSLTSSREDALASS